MGDYTPTSLKSTKNGLFITVVVMVFLFLAQKGYGSQHVISEVLRIDNSTGLSSQKVYSLAEDASGAIWISTKSGVDRYNGRILKNYSLEGDSFYGDRAGRIIRLYHNEGDLYAYESTGKIHKYSPVYDSFILTSNLSDLSHGDVVLNKMLVNNDGSILYATNNGLFKYVSDKDYRPILPGSAVNDIIIAKGYLFAATSSGLKFMRNDHAVKDIGLLKDTKIQSLYFDEENDALYIGAFNKGLYKLDLSDFSVAQIHATNSMLHKPIRSIVKLSPERLAIGIDGSGVLAYNVKANSLATFVNTELAPEFSFTGNGIYALLSNGHGNLWIGSYTGGVTMVSLSQSPIQIITHIKDNPNSLVNNNVNYIIESTDGNIWYATDRGISIYNPRTGIWRNSLSGIVVVSLCEDGNGNVLAGCYGDGVYRMDLSGNIKGHWTQSDGALSSNYIFAIQTDCHGKIWVGSPHGCLVALNSDGSLYHRFEIDGVMSISVVDEKRIGVATGNGFYIIDADTNSYNWYANFQEQSEHDVSAYIIPMMFTKGTTVWLGTESGGLNLYDYKNRKIIREIKMSDGLPSNDIYGLVHDDKGRLWASTGNGLAIIGDSTVSSLNFINGIAREYNKSSILRTSNGDLIFGSTAGAVRLSPDKISVAEYSAPLRISRFTIDGISEEESAKIIPELFEMLQNRNIELSASHNSFDVDFEAINIDYRNDIAYQYILEGYDHDWSEMTMDGTARFRNVPPGNYTLKIKALRKSDGRVIDETSIDITVEEPWWNTIWARICYLAIIAFIIYFKDALRFLENHYPDIIISDVMMPGIQGDELCSMIKNNPDTAGIPVILLTAKTTHDAIVNGIEKGADDYIAKPFSLDILKSKVRGMLHNRKRIREYLMRLALTRAEGDVVEVKTIPQTVEEPTLTEGNRTSEMPASDKAFVDKAVDIIIANMSNTEFDIEHLCREMAMSRTLFFGRLKSLTGKAPQEFIRVLKLERAAELLKQKTPVAEVAVMTGFANSKYFSTVFKKHFGVSPSKFCEQN